MNLTRHIAFHTGLQIAGRVLGLAVSIITFGLLTRYLGAEGFGNYTTVLAYLFFFAALSDLGLYVFTVNELGKTKDKNKLLSAIFGLRLATALAALGLAAALGVFFPYPFLVKIGIIITSGAILFTLLDQLASAFYQVKLKTTRPAIMEFISKTILLIGVFIAIKLKLSLIFILLAVVLAEGIRFAINWAGIKKAINVSFSFDLNYWRLIIKKTWPIALSGVFVLFYFKSDTVFISLLRPPEVAQVEVGIYGAAYKILEVLIGFPPLFLGLVSPLLSQAWQQGQLVKFQKIYQKAFDALSLITWPIIFGGFVLAQQIINLLAPGFDDSIGVLRILIIATGIIFWSHLPMFAVVALGKQKTMLKYYFLAALIAFIGYLALIPLFSYWAAAVITVGVELFILLTTSLIVLKAIQTNLSKQIFWKSLLSAGLMGLVLLLINSPNLFFNVLIGAAVYLSLTISTGALGREILIMVFRKNN